MGGTRVSSGSEWVSEASHPAPGGSGHWTDFDWLGANDQGVLSWTTQPAEGAAARGRGRVGGPKPDPINTTQGCLGWVGHGFSRAECPLGGPELRWGRPVLPAGSSPGTGREVETPVHGGIPESVTW